MRYITDMCVTCFYETNCLFRVTKLKSKLVETVLKIKPIVQATLIFEL